MGYILCLLLVPADKTLPTKLVTTPCYGVTDTLVADCASTPLTLLKLPYRNLGFCKLRFKLTLTAERLLFLYRVQSKVFFKRGLLGCFGLGDPEKVLRFLLVQYPYLLRPFAFVI